jgi:hypothetical protein
MHEQEYEDLLAHQVTFLASQSFPTPVLVLLQIKSSDSSPRRLYRAVILPRPHCISCAAARLPCAAARLPSPCAAARLPHASPRRRRSPPSCTALSSPMRRRSPPPCAAHAPPLASPKRSRSLSPSCDTNAARRSPPHTIKWHRRSCRPA